MTTFTENCLIIPVVSTTGCPPCFHFPPARKTSGRSDALFGNQRRQTAAPVLVCEAAKILSVSEDESFRTAAALEILHSYSLIHDDLPSMDNDDLRRGKPTCHKNSTKRPPFWPETVC